MTKAKKILLASFSFIVSYVFSASMEVEEAYNYRFDPGYPVNENQMIKAYNAPARIDTTGQWDLFLGGAFILWQPKEQGLDIALITPVVAPTQNEAYILNTHFKYTPGFKVFLGTHFNQDDWSLWTEYTRLHPNGKADRNVAITAETITNYWRLGSTVNNLTSISSKWHLNLDLLDLSLGRSFYVGKKLTLNPFIGLRGGWIDQDMKVQYTNNEATSYLTAVKADSWVLGPKTGVCSNWLITDGFRAFGNAAASVFYQSFNLSAKEHEITTPLVLSSNYSDKPSYLNTNLEIALGFGWGSYFKNKRCHFDLTAGYEMVVFWNQNMMRSFVEEIKNQTNSKDGNLTPHGFVVAIKFDF